MKNTLCGGKGPKSCIGLWASPGTNDKFEKRKKVVKGTPN